METYAPKSDHYFLTSFKKAFFNSSTGFKTCIGAIQTSLEYQSPQMPWILLQILWGHNEVPRQPRGINSYSGSSSPAATSLWPFAILTLPQQVVSF